MAGAPEGAPGMLGREDAFLVRVGREAEGEAGEPGRVGEAEVIEFGRQGKRHGNSLSTLSVAGGVKGIRGVNSASRRKETARFSGKLLNWDKWRDVPLGSGTRGVCST